MAPREVCCQGNLPLPFRIPSIISSRNPGFHKTEDMFQQLLLFSFSTPIPSNLPECVKGRPKPGSDERDRPKQYFASCTTSKKKNTVTKGPCTLAKCLWQCLSGAPGSPLVGEGLWVIWLDVCTLRGFPGAASGKESTCQCKRHKRHSLIPGSGGSPGGGHGYTLQYPCLENPMDRGAWWAILHGAAKSWS